MPISSRAASRGRRVSLSSVMQYRTCGRHRQVARRDSTKLVSVAPRSSRLNSSILPRLRSHPIQRPSRSFHWRTRWKRKNRSRAVGACLALSASMPARAAARISASRGSVSVGRVAEVAQDREVDVADRRCRAPGPRGARAARRRASTLSRIVGTITIVRAASRHAVEVEPRQPPRRDQPRDEPLHDLDGQLARRHQRQQRHQHAASAPSPAVTRRRSRPRRRRGAASPARWCRGSPGVAWRKSESPDSQRRSRASTRCPRSNRPAAAANQVVADVGRRARRASRSATCRARSTLLSATRICPSPVGSASSSTACR